MHSKDQPHASNTAHAHGRKSYVRFAAMIVTSTVIMYGLTYLNTYQLSHVFFSETRAYMSLIMGAAMAVIMLSFMLKMHSDWRINAAIYGASVVIFAAALWLVRSQRTVEDVSYMRAMIPHHSIAILTSERAQISDPRVRKLADQIIQSQRKEIEEMKTLVAEIEGQGKKQTTTEEKTEGSTDSTEQSGTTEVPPPDPSAVQVPSGYKVEVVLSGLTYPTSVEFDNEGAMYVAEAGYSYGDPTAEPRILRVSPQGRIETLVQGDPLVGPVNDLLWHDEQMFVSHRGKISVVERDGKVRDLVTGLPSEGDHHTNQLTIGPDAKLYVGQGTATNSGVVGLDNYKMGWLKKHPDLHEVPARDVKFLDRAYETPNPLENGQDKVETSAFHPFAKSTMEGSTVKGETKSSGTILRMNPDGSELEVYAWGLRNPFGLMWSPDGTLFATENGCDVRGSRPIANDEEDIYVIKEDAWYGWPDYAMGLPVTHERFKPEDHPQPQFVMAEHPSVERPWLNFPKHSSITKLEFSESDTFGKGHMFVAFFGHMSPMTGKAPEQHGGHRVVRINPATRHVETFFGKREHDGHGQAQKEEQNKQHGKNNGGGHHDGKHQDESVSSGPRRLIDVRFDRARKALYVVDFGSMVVKKEPKPIEKTGLIWRVFPQDSAPSGPPANLSTLK